MVARGAPPKPAKTPALAAAEGVVLERLRARDFLGAFRTVAEYELRRPKPRGIGFNWGGSETAAAQAAGLEAIYASKANDTVADAAAMMFLWGVSKPYRRWLSAEAKADAAAQKLARKAQQAVQSHHDRRAFERFGVRR